MTLETIPLDAKKRTTSRPKTFDGSTGEVVPIPRTPLKTLDHVRNELAKVYRAMKRGHLPAEDGTKRAYVLSTLGKVIEAADLVETLIRERREAADGVP